MPVKYTKEILEEAVRASRSISEVLRKLGVTSISGGQHAHIKARIKAYGIDARHLPAGQGWSRGREVGRTKTPEQILIRGPNRRGRPKLLRRALIASGVPHTCAVCRQGAEWNGKPLVLQIDHRDGDRANDEQTNLRFLCPNCHSQTGNYGRKNKRV